MVLGRLFRVLVIGAGALLGSACATSSASGSPGETQRLPDGGVVTPPPAPTMQGGGAPSGW